MSTLKLFARKTAATLLDKSGVLRLRTAWGERFRVLMYHRVIDPESVPYPIEPGMYVRPETFRMHMRVLARDANLLPLDELASMISQRRRIPRRSVAVTFDDGWYDNLAYAHPILSESRIPATLFLATSFIGSSSVFWTDTAAIALRASRPAGGLHTLVDERTLRNALPSTLATETLSAFGRLHTMEEIHALNALLAHLFRMTIDARAIVIQELDRLVPESFRKLRYFLTWGEVGEMAAQGITLGSHTHRHHLSTEISAEELRADIEDSLDTLSTKGFHVSTTFCYPGGRLNETTQNVLSSLPFKSAVTTRRATDRKAKPLLVGRTGMHEDISSTASLFSARLWSERRF